MTIIPSLLYPNLDDFRQRFNECLEAVDEVHIDFADGVFVENVLPGVDEVLSLKGDIAMEAHLMVQSPQAWVERLLEDSRCQRIIVHAESDANIGELLERIHTSGRKAGVALKPGTSVDVLAQWVDWVDQVLVLFVDPGFNGTPFKPEVVNTISAIRQLAPNAEISADGGMNPTTIPLIIDAGVSRIAVGSYLHGKPLSSSLTELNQIAANREEG